MYVIRRTPAARAAEEAMPESLSVAFGAYLDVLADNPWSLGSRWGDAETRHDTFGMSGRGIILFRINDDAEPHEVLIAQLSY